MNDKPLTADELRAYRERWKLVNEFTEAEHRDRPVAERIRDFFYLMEQAKALGWKTTDEAEIEMVRSRWRKLRDATHG